MKKKIIIVIGTLVVLASLVVVAILVGNRENEQLIQETEERVCQIVVKDISNQAMNEIINAILSQLQNTGQVIINTDGEQIILVPLEQE